jgi:hypothetical protein
MAKAQIAIQSAANIGSDRRQRHRRLTANQANTARKTPASTKMEMNQ